MKAIVFERYGGVENLSLRKVAIPAPEAGAVLVKVHAASVNSWDWEYLHGAPVFNRVWGGLFKPKFKTLGGDIAGVVEAAGSQVTAFQPGDAVFGDIAMEGFGGFAEYVTAPAHLLARKPEAMSFEQAAAIPEAGLLALQSIRKVPDLGPDHRVLINGAGGGVGPFAIQIAKSVGAEITAVDHTRKLSFLRQMGADRVIDYTTTDYTKTGDHYDLVVDVNVTRSLVSCLRTLAPGGLFLVVGGKVPGMITQFGMLGPLLGKMMSKRAELLMLKPNRDDLDQLSALFTAGTLQPVIDQVYPLAETADALQKLGEGRSMGKVVVRVM